MTYNAPSMPHHYPIVPSMLLPMCQPSPDHWATGGLPMSPDPSNLGSSTESPGLHTTPDYPPYPPDMSLPSPLRTPGQTSVSPYYDGNFDGTQRTPPLPHGHGFTPSTQHNDGPGDAWGARGAAFTQHAQVPHFVRMHQVQPCADNELEEHESSFAHLPAQYGCNSTLGLQEGCISFDPRYYPPPDQAVQSACQQSPPHVDNKNIIDQHAHNLPSHSSPHRFPSDPINPTTNRSQSSPTLTAPTTPKPSRNPTPKKPKSTTHPWPCLLAPNGCPCTSQGKNEWKRHIDTMHLQPYIWICDICPADKSSLKPFNRKDLFRSHVERIHLEKAGARREKKGAKQALTAAQKRELDARADRCCRPLRPLPEKSRCPFAFCAVGFDERVGWGKRLEHVARHFEQEMGKGGGGRAVDWRRWERDEELEAWLLEQRMERSRKGERVVLK